MIQNAVFSSGLAAIDGSLRKATWKNVHSNGCLAIVMLRSDAYHLSTVRMTVIDNRHAKATDDIKRSPLS